MTSAGSRAFDAAVRSRGPGAGLHLARVLGTTESTISRWRHGVCAPGAGYRLALQEIFQIPWRSWAEAATEALADTDVA